MKKLFILLFSIVMAGEMEVDGNLKVTGTVESTTIDSLHGQINSLLILISQLEIRIAQLECQNTGIIPDGYCDCFFHILDACGVCNGDHSSCEDCAGVPNGDNLQDMCGYCDNDPSNDCIQDCTGEWGGAAVEDVCGDCGGDAISEEECSITDIDGNTYEIVEIGDQIWMAENIKTSPNRICYDDDPENCEIYGGLYNRESAQNACPAGWHVASEGDYFTLYSNYGGIGSASSKLKDNELWNGTNESGFSALPGGFYFNDGNHAYSHNGGDENFLWTSNMNGIHGSNVKFHMDNIIIHENRNEFEQQNLYFSVRCIKD